MTNKPIPRITVRIDRGEDWAEYSGDWQEQHPAMCGSGILEDWLDYGKLYQAYLKLNEAVME